MARDLNALDFFALYLGGKDGGQYVAGATATTAKQIQLIEVMEDIATFSVLSGENQDGTSRNMLTGNGYTGIAFNRGDLIYAPYGGFISAFTCDKAVRYFSFPDTNRTLNKN